MKTLKLLFLCAALAGMAATWQSCEEEVDPTCTDGIQNGTETGIDCGGACAACPTCTDGIQNGDETGVDCGGPDCEPCYVAIENTKWQSSGANVAPVFVAVFSTDSVYAQFNGDHTYVMERFDNGVKKAFEGTYVQAVSAVADIWAVALSQTAPSVITSEGIFQITADTMKFEVIQTNPPAGTAPTPAGGFGSSNGGAQGMNFVQTYVRVQ